ncbi:hypothetical protein CP978_26640 [Streptomyces nodosus]|uniref:Uncharacterized protein n=1 Tax=Streptomyces nodosus TaxID=40318 RepID=A0A5P2WBH0_9ACTN|nr:hypothetical protein CP978_26640 [Streptomyces nodosus]
MVSGLGSRSFNVRNDSKRHIEVFNGATCDNGAPIATVGPHSSANGIRVFRHIPGGVKVKHGVVASFRVIGHHHRRGGAFFESGGFEEGGGGGGQSGK